jgi:hypothetical protein
MRELKPGKAPAGLKELIRDVPKEVKVLLSAEGGVLSEVSKYLVGLEVPAFGQRDYLLASVLMEPNFDVSAVDGRFKRSDGFDFPFKVDLVSHHDIDAKQLIDVLCMDVPFDIVFAMADRACRGMLDGGDDGSKISLEGTRKVSQSVVDFYFPAVNKTGLLKARYGFIAGGVSRDDTVNELVAAGYDAGRASRAVTIWEVLKSARENLKWKGFLR